MMCAPMLGPDPDTQLRHNVDELLRERYQGGLCVGVGIGVLLALIVALASERPAPRALDCGDNAAIGVTHTRGGHP